MKSVKVTIEATGQATGQVTGQVTGVVLKVILAEQIKQNIARSQVKAYLAPNKEMLWLNWQIGNEMPEISQPPVAKLPVLENDIFSQQVVVQLPDSLRTGDKTLQQPVVTIVQHAVAQIPWGHNILNFSKSKTIAETNFYANLTF